MSSSAGLKQRKGGKPEVACAETDDETKRLTKLIEAASEKAPEKLAPYIRSAAPFLAMAWTYFMIALPFIITGVSKAQAFIAGLPEKVIYAAVGFLVCFFGGIFPATIAAAEAWQVCGGRQAVKCCQDLYGEFCKVQDANNADESKDEDNDGVPDVKQISSQQLLTRKVQLVMKTVEPETLSSGIVGLYTGWIGVLCVLKIKFAKTVTLGEAIGAKLYVPMSKFEPMLVKAVPEEYKKWVPVAVRWSCKALAISVAWWISRVIEAFHSAIRGGILFGKYLVDYLHELKILKFDSEQAYLDEAIGWGIAVLGLFFQFWMGFGVPFPLNLVLWPLQLLEAFICFSVSHE